MFGGLRCVVVSGTPKMGLFLDHFISTMVGGDMHVHCNATTWLMHLYLKNKGGILTKVDRRSGVRIKGGECVMSKIPLFMLSFIRTFASHPIYLSAGLNYCICSWYNVYTYYLIYDHVHVIIIL